MSLIDDFNDGNTQLVAADGRAGAWYFYDDRTNGEQTHNVAVVDGNTALHVTSSKWTTWGSGFGATLAPASNQTRACAYDASAYSGLEFRAKGSGHVRLRLPTPKTTPVAEGGTCTLEGDACYDWPGVWFDLEPDWRVYKLPFCMLRPEGWTAGSQELDLSQISAVHFLLKEGLDVDFWLDDVSFTQADPALSADAAAASCALPCPLEAAPRTARFTPEHTYLPLTGGLELHTFEQDSVRCGPLTRRYLSFVPQALKQDSAAPILIALHGSGANAESMQDLQARGRLDALAQRDGVIVIYGNAAPGASSSADPTNPNSGSWRQAYFDDGEVDDVEYLRMILADLKRRRVTNGENRLYLTGVSNGGGMVLRAGRELAARVTGIAPFMPFDGISPLPVPDLQTATLKRVLFAYANQDPGLGPNYTATLSQLPEQWATALGIPADVISIAAPMLLPNTVSEGSSYTGTNSIALRTRDSSPSQLDYVHPAADARVRTLIFDHAGHFWPTPKGDTEAWILDRWGFRNQDLDAAEALWAFFELGSAQ